MEVTVKLVNGILMEHASQEMQNYIHNNETCRRRMLLQVFGSIYKTVLLIPLLT
jgi:hypothetical protein